MLQSLMINELKNRWRGGLGRKGHSLTGRGGYFILGNLPRVDLFNSQHFRLSNPAYTVYIEACNLLQNQETTPLQIVYISYIV